MREAFPWLVGAGIVAVFVFAAWLVYRWIKSGGMAKAQAALAFLNKPKP